MPVKPITPSDMPAREFPDEVVQAFNDVIAKSHRKGTATFKQKEVVKLIKDRLECNETKSSMSIGLMSNRYLNRSGGK
jgi:hypothetical protein